MSVRQIDPLVVFDHVQLGYAGQTVLADVDLTVPGGAFVAIVGPNGSGKTTLVRGMLGLLAASSGTITRRWEKPGRNLPRSRPAYVPQRGGVNHHLPLSAADVVMMGRYPNLGLFARPDSGDRRAVRHALERVGLEYLADKAFSTLSGGQQQRILLARALACESNALILDEPTNGLDMGSAEELLVLLRRLNRDEGLTIVMITHFLELAASYADDVIFTSHGRVTSGSTTTMVKPEVLKQVYGLSVSVIRHEGRTLVVPRGKEGSGNAGEPAV